MITFIVPKNAGLSKCRELAKAIAQQGSIIQEMRGEDIPFFVESLIQAGKKAIGITGEDLFREFVLSSKNTKLTILRRDTWNDSRCMFGKPSLCLLGSKEMKLEDMNNKLRICINKKYKELAKKYCTNILENKGYKIEKIYSSGTTEEFYSKGIADLVIDIVCSGKSAEKAGLMVYEKIFESDIVIIGENREENFDLDKLYKTIKQRIENGDKESYTNELVNNELVLKRKLIEEAAEVITAKNREELVKEAADLLYFLLVILAKEGVGLSEIEEENGRRDAATKQKVNKTPPSSRIEEKKDVK